MGKFAVFFAMVFFLSAFFAITADTTFAQEKRVEINLSEQKLQAFSGDEKVFDFVISTGKPWWPTPTGTFYPWIKLRLAGMQGGSVTYGTYYNLLNVPYVIYFGNNEVPNWRGYGLHGTYWHNNFGYPMSHGCVNLKTPDMEKLYYWMEMSTPIHIFGQTPQG